MREKRLKKKLSIVPPKVLAGRTDIYNENEWRNLAQDIAEQESRRRPSMEIKTTGALSAYRSSRYEADKKNKVSASAPQNKKMDKADFSAFLRPAVSVRSAAAQAADASASSEKISFLQEKIRSGQYHIPARTVASAILGEEML